MHCWHIITQSENILLTSQDFHLPGKKVLQSSDNHFEAVLIDVSEHPIERPKKTAKVLLRQKENTCAKNTGSSGEAKQKDSLYLYRQESQARFSVIQRK